MYVRLLKVCCIDMLWYNLQSSLTVYLKEFIKKAKSYKNQVCINLFPESHKYNASTESYMMVAECDLKSTREQKELCANGSVEKKNDIPVEGGDGYLYRNIHCAVCNNVQEIKSTQVQLACDLKTDKCSYTLSGDNLHSCGTRPNYQGCNNTESAYYNLCNSFFGPVDKYINYFCWLCHEESHNINFTELSCSSTDRYSGVPISWRSLLSFIDGPSSKTKCKNTGIHQVIEGECNVLQCPPGYKAEKSKCISNNEIHARTSFENCFRWKNIYLYMINVTEHIEEISMDIVGFGPNYKFFEKYVDGETTIYKTRIPITSLLLADVFYPHNSISHRLISNYSKVLFIPYNIPYELIINSDYRKLFPLNRKCTNIAPLDAHRAKFTNNCNVVYMGEKFDIRDISIWMEFTKKTRKTQSMISTCKNYSITTPCSLQVISSNTKMLKNKTLVVRWKEKREIYDTNDYLLLLDGTIGVCLKPDKSVDGGWYTNVTIIEGYISIGGSILSFFSFIWLIGTIVLYKEVQNIAGLCVLALCICLFVGDTLFLIANILYMFEIVIGESLCEFIAILMHSSLLASQIWGVLLARDMMVNVTSMVRPRDKKNVIKHYAIISFFVTAIMIFAAVMSRRNNVIDISYGKDGFCFLHGFYGRIIFYYSPLLVSFVTSVFLLAMLLYRISSQLSISREVLESIPHRINTTKISLKLVLICGISEGIGFINVGRSNLTENEMILNSLFGVLYSIVKSCRGVFLLIVFINRKMVIDFYRRKFEEMTIIRRVRSTEIELEGR